MINYHLKVACRGLWRDKWINLLCMLSIGVGLFMVSLAALTVHNIEAVTGKLPERFSIGVYLADGLSPDEVQDIMRALRREPGVKSTRYISKEAAMAELRSSMKDAEYVFEGLEENPLPASIDVGLRQGAVTGPAVQELARKISAIKGVADVEYGRKLLRIIQSIRRNARFLGGFLVSGLSIAMLFVCYSTVKILFFRKQNELETLKLLGATRGFIRAPFLIEGGIIGAGGGIIGSAAMAALLYAFYERFPGPVPLLGAIGVPLELFWGVPLAGFLLGVVGSFIAIGRIKF